MLWRESSRRNSPVSCMFLSLKRGCRYRSACQDTHPPSAQHGSQLLFRPNHYRVSFFHAEHPWLPWKNAVSVGTVKGGATKGAIPHIRNLPHPRLTRDTQVLLALTIPHALAVTRFLWGSGSLSSSGWTRVAFCLPCVLFGDLPDGQLFALV